MSELATLGRESAAACPGGGDMRGLPALMLDAQQQLGPSAR